MKTWKISLMVVAMFSVLFGIGVGSSAAYSVFNLPTSEPEGDGTLTIFASGSAPFNDVEVQYEVIGDGTFFADSDINDPAWITPNGTNVYTNLGGGLAQNYFTASSLQTSLWLFNSSGDWKLRYLGITIDGETVYSIGDKVPELPAGAVIPLGLGLLIGIAWLRRKNPLLAKTSI
jgi:hypothetical protein